MKVYHANLYRQAGYLAVVDGTWRFLDARTSAVTDVLPPMVNWLTTLGEVPERMAWQLVDKMRGQHEYLFCGLGN